MKPFFVFVLGLCLPVLIVAQRMYRCGYLVDRFGDTLSGQISFDHWKEPGKILFKAPGSPVARYSLYEIRLIVFPGSDTYKRIIDEEGPKILHSLVDGGYIQLYEQMGGECHFYLGYGEDFMPAVIDPRSFKPLPKPIYKDGCSYVFSYYDPRKGVMPLVDTLELKGTFFSKPWLEELAYKLNGGANARSFTSFRPSTHFVPFIGAGRGQAIVTGGPDRAWLSVLAFEKQPVVYVEAGVDIYNNWFFKGFRLRLSASYLPRVAISGRNKSDSTLSTVNFYTRQSMSTVGAALLYGHSIGKVCSYAYLGISNKLQILNYNRPSLYTTFDGTVTHFPDELAYYKAGMSTGLKAGLLFSRAARIEVTGFYDWGFGFANSNRDGYSLYRNTAGVGIAFHFARRPQDLHCKEKETIL
ncbi:hypothetical protein [Chitinophaga tropicalis]|uniref:Uncharacterized protein n=1 Tax=Chitinophaga tropicalis TaxID=2683588 RepID=A0A7K1U039_9BACT|nr:hypothetical protein [Chitinophaga tropicalis]MVT07713.1 hypothetical protein [Chitinophaga tropicalis]